MDRSLDADGSMSMNSGLAARDRYVIGALKLMVDAAWPAPGDYQGADSVNSAILRFASWTLGAVLAHLRSI